MKKKTKEKLNIESHVLNDGGRVALNENLKQNPPTVSAMNTPLKEKHGGMAGNKQRGDLKKGVFYIIISAFFYSLMSLFVRLAGDIPTFQKAFFRNVIAAVVGLALLIKSGSFKMQKGSLPALLGRSIAGAVGIICNFYAIDHIPISDASILNKLAPFFSIAFSVFILKEKALWKDWLFVGLAFVGALFVVQPTAGLASLPAVIGAIGGLGAGLAYTFVRLLGKKGERTAYVVFFFSAFSCLTMLPMVIVQYEAMELAQVGWLLLAGLAASGAQLSVTAAYTYAPAKEVSVYDYSQVLFTAVWGMLFLGQFPSDLWVIVGYVIIIGAAVLKKMQNA